MKLFLIRIQNFVKTIYSLIYLNLYFLFTKLTNKNYKILFFYFPVKSYQDNLIELIKELEKEKNYKVFIGFNLGSSREVKSNKNSFFLNLGYLKYLFNLNMFLSSYIVYILPQSQNKIYINHDIYDAPMVSRDNENKLSNSLKKYDYIFMSSEITSNMLINKIDQLKTSENINKPKIINTGYLKLDHVNKIVNEKEEVEDSILLAPTKSQVFLEYDMSEHIDKVINKILSNKDLKIIYRPHPGDLKDPLQRKKIFKTNELFNSNKQFFLDTNTSYLDSYKRAKFMITDFSGTAYTYAFCKLKPIIFYSKNENELQKSDLSELYYFKDRPDVGIVESNIDNLNEKINYIHNNIKIFSEKIKNLRLRRIEYFNRSMDEHLKNIKKILDNEKKN